MKNEVVKLCKNSIRFKVVSSKPFSQVSGSKGVDQRCITISEPEANYKIMNIDLDAMIGQDLGVLSDVQYIFNVGGGEKSMWTEGSLQ